MTREAPAVLPLAMAFRIPWLRPGRASRAFRWTAWLNLLVASACLFTAAETIVDPDLWGHLTFGRDILQSGSIVQKDRYSYLSDRPWINHEWLAEVSFAGIYQAVGPPGLVAFKMLIALSVLGIGAYRLRRRGVSPLLSGLFLLAVALAIRPGLGTIRPQLFTYICFFAVILVLDRASQGRTHVLWMLVPVFAVWSNAHGGFLAGAAIAGLWLAVTVATILGDRTRRIGPRAIEIGQITLPLAIAFFALSWNPCGFGLIRFLLQTATVPRPEISEWAPLQPLSLPAGAYLVLLAISIWGWTARRPRRCFALDAIHLVTAAVPLMAVRHLPLFALASLVLAADSIALRCREYEGRCVSIAAPRPSLVACLGLMALAMCVLSVRATRGVRIEPEVFGFPTRAVDLLGRSGLSGNLLVDFDWGEYVIWSLGDRIKVSIDGRRETVYSARMLGRNLVFRAGGPGWETMLALGSPGLALLRRGSPSDRRLENEPGWSVVYEDSLCALHLRNDATAQARWPEMPPSSLPCDGRGLWLPSDPTAPAEAGSLGSGDEGSRLVHQDVTASRPN